MVTLVASVQVCICAAMVHLPLALLAMLSGVVVAAEGYQISGAYCATRRLARQIYILRLNGFLYHIASIYASLWSFDTGVAVRPHPVALPLSRLFLASGFGSADGPRHCQSSHCCAYSSSVSWCAIYYFTSLLPHERTYTRHYQPPITLTLLTTALYACCYTPRIELPDRRL